MQTLETDDTKIYSGRLDLSGDWDILSIDGEKLAEAVEADFWPGRKVFVRYFISEEPFESLRDAEERFVRSVYGLCTAEYSESWGSEWTGQYGADETLTVGGHNLIDELKSYLGKYALVAVRTEA